MTEKVIDRLVAAAVAEMQKLDGPGNMVSDYGLPWLPGSAPTTTIEIDGRIDVPDLVKAIVTAMRDLPMQQNGDEHPVIEKMRSYGNAWGCGLYAWQAAIDKILAE